MRTDIDHLPAAKQRELERVVQIIFEEFEDATKLALGDRKMARMLKIILYGSFARGDWVDEPHTSKAYVSDFDLLIIVNQDEVTDRATYWHRADERLIREQTIRGAIATPTNFIVHTLQEVNNNLAQGRYSSWISRRRASRSIRPTTASLPRRGRRHRRMPSPWRRSISKSGSPASIKRFDIAQYEISKVFTKQAAFDLHQAAEGLYNCILLTCTLYTSHSHNPQFFRSQADKIGRRLLYLWPVDSRADRARFTRLKDAYVKARYSKHYRISAEDLEWLQARIEELGPAVHAVCGEHLERLRSLAASDPT